HLAPIVPVAMLGLALFVSFMQAFVFSLLTAVYISMSFPHSEDDHH
ncbi:MAG: F0F1-type ATP synthase membrane subunit a, partial [Myxococcota bacterium]